MPCPSAVENQSTFTNAAGIAKSPLSIERFPCNVAWRKPGCNQHTTHSYQVVGYMHAGGQVTPSSSRPKKSVSVILIGIEHHVEGVKVASLWCIACCPCAAHYSRWYPASHSHRCTARRRAQAIWRHLAGLSPLHRVIRSCVALR